ncbi:MAG: hypothetical protein DRR11_09795 [Gammaproteobacteria bacterium]|nr:MAG: hypothetical protein DRR11_09795 [Gammaproteobacteria bacterium]RLA36103.1 MAG: hypothetical protein DRR15_05725 [Gammaproteobacteria bacterium]
MRQYLLRMTSTTLLLLAGAAAMAQAAQIAEDWKAELAAARELVKAERVAVITEEMHFTAEENEAFWPLYEEYHRDMLVVQDRHVQLVADFVGKYYDYKLTDADAKQILSDYFVIKEDLRNIQKSYVSKFENIMSSIKVMRFYQLENKISAEIDAALAVMIPLADPS